MGIDSDRQKNKKHTMTWCADPVISFQHRRKGSAKIAYGTTLQVFYVLMRSFEAVDIPLTAMSVTTPVTMQICDEYASFDVHDTHQH
jgi:hypothetical protein